MVCVFKTSVKTKRAVKQLKPYLDQLLQTANWNFDLQDCDNILRIDSSVEISETIIKVLRENGFACEELLD